MIDSIIPKNEEHWLQLRTKDITSTEVAALFGVSPYLTEFELWHRKKDGLIVQHEGNERTKWGARLQDAIAIGIAEEDKLAIRKKVEYMRDDEINMGSSFDFCFYEDAGSSKEKGILEIKNVDSLVFKNEWQVDKDTVEAPLHIELQVQHQLGLTGLSQAIIGALVGGNKLVKLQRTPNHKLINSIKIKIDMFWKSIALDKPPKPNFILDAEFIKSLYGSASQGKVVSASDYPDILGLVKKHHDLGIQQRNIEAQREGVKAEILTHIQDAEKVIGDDFTISASMTKPVPVSFMRAGYRNFRIHMKGDKK